MKRDMELIRKILLYIEDKSNGASQFNVIIYGYTDEEIGYHNDILIKSSLAVGILDRTRRALRLKYPVYSMKNLTPAGHDFLDLIRSDTVWNKTKEKATKVGGWTINILKDIAIGIIISKLSQ